MSRAVLISLAALFVLVSSGCGSKADEKPDNPGGAVIKTEQADLNGLRGAVLDTP